MAAPEEFELGWLCSVVARHTPAFFLHPADRYLPCSAEFFLQHSELREGAPGEGGPAGALLLPRGCVAAQLLLEAQRGLPPGRYQWLHLDPAARGGMPLESLDDVPVYAHPKLVVGPDGRPEAVEISYCTLYAHNGAYRVGGVGLITTGAHDGDWEHCTARVHPESGELLGVWYNAHRSRDGCWVAAHQVPRDGATGRVAAHVALHGHGTYPRPGRVLRHFFLGNDLCSREGPVWRPRRVVLLPPLHEEAAAAAEGRGPAAAGAAGRHGTVPLDSAPAGGGSPVDSLPAGMAGLTIEEGAAGQTDRDDGGWTNDGDAPATRPGGRRLVRAPSRGSSLPLHAAAEAVAAVAGADPAAAAAAGGGGTAVPAAGGAAVPAAGGAAVPEVVADDPCHWVFFRGGWGTTPAPICQAWFHRAEPPASRTTLLRLFGHFVPEP